MKNFWLFKKINFGLRTEVIINISFLMLAAILLIGFTISKTVERNILREKIRYGERMVQDFQTIIDFISRDKKEFTLDNSITKKELQNFVQLYAKGKDFYELLIVDTESNILVSKRSELINRRSTDPFLQKSIQSGELRTEIVKSGNFL